jgi:CBS domain-containing protein
MTAVPITIRPDLSLRALITLFEGHDLDGFPVVTSDGVLRGVVTKLDLLRVLRPDPDLHIPEFDRMATRTVAEIMHGGVITVEPTDPIAAAVDLMVETRLHLLPVVKRGSGPPVLVGLVSQGDLLRTLVPEE